MKVFISVDIEGINGVCNWDETETNKANYEQFRAQLQREVNAACEGAIAAGATEIFIKDAHDSARNLKILELPECAKLHRGWDSTPCCMMAGLDETFDAVMFVGYHSPSRSNGNPLAHTMNTTRVQHVKINGKIASEFTINSLYAASLKVPVAFVSGDLNLCNQAKEINSNIETVATKEGRNGAVISDHPLVTCRKIKESAEKSLRKDLKDNVVYIPKGFDIEIQYRHHTQASNASFFPGCKLLGSDKVIYHSDNYNDVLVMFKFLLSI